MDAAALRCYCQCRSAIPLPRLYSATGRARRRKWRYIKYTPLPLPFTVHGTTAAVDMARAQQPRATKEHLALGTYYDI